MNVSQFLEELPQHVAERSKEKAILLALWTRPAFTTEIAQITRVKRYNLYFHLRKLEEDGLVLRERVGRMDRFRIDDGRRDRVARLLLEDREIAVDPTAREVLMGKRERKVRTQSAPTSRIPGMISAITTDLDYDEEPGYPPAEVVVRTVRISEGVEGRNVIANALTRLGCGDEVEGIDLVDNIVIIGRRILE